MPIDRGEFFSQISLLKQQGITKVSFLCFKSIISSRCFYSGYNKRMTTLLIYSFFTLLSLAIPLAIYKHSKWMILGACIAEILVILLIYSSTFVLCQEGEACGNEWAAKIIPILIATMNIGMLWPILAGYAKQDALNKEKDSRTEQEENES